MKHMRLLELCNVPATPVISSSRDTPYGDRYLEYSCNKGLHVDIAEKQIYK